MEKSKLVLILKTLNKSEMKKFRQFLACKLFNDRERAIDLLDYISAQLTATNQKLDKETVFKKLFPGKPYRAKTIRDLMSYLSVPLDKFIAFQKLYNHEGDELIALCKAYREKGMMKLFESTTAKTATLLKNSKFRDSSYHQRTYQLEQERYYASTEKGRGHTTNLSEVAQSLDVSYFTNRLRQSCYMLSHQSVYNISYDFRIVEEIIKEVKHQDLLHIPAISIYYYCYLAQLYPNHLSYFKSLQNSLVANANLFTVSEMKDIYLLAINIAIKRYNQGATEIIPDLLKLYRSGVSQKILLTNNVLSRFTYKNIIALALFEKQFEWVMEFMKEYTPLLEEAYRELTYQFNLAKYHYTKQEYDQALQLLFLLNSNDDIYINMDTKILLSRIYYEQNELDSLHALVDSFKKTLTRKKQVLGYHQLSYQNFISYLNKLIILNPFDRSAKKALLEEVESSQQLPDRYWFIEQLKTL